MVPGLVLDGSILAWLHGLCPSAQPDDLDVTYNLSHPLNHSRTGAVSVQRASRLFWKVEFFEAGGRPVLDGWLARNLLPSFPLVSMPGTGVVVRNERLHVLLTYRGQGFASAVYDSEDRLYRRWGVREIHLTAEKDGPVVWVKKRGFVPQDIELVRADWRRWCRRTGHPLEFPDDVSQLPEEFLLSCYSAGHLELYKVL